MSVIDSPKSVREKVTSTPLPWVVGDGAGIFSHDGSNWIADCNQLNGLSFEESEANARFIVDAIKALEHLIECRRSNNDTETWWITDRGYQWIVGVK